MSEPMAETRKKWTFQWKELYDEVITSGLCTGCAGCVIACPHDVIGYEHEPGKYRPFHLEDEAGTDDCVHGQKGFTSCTRALSSPSKEATFSSSSQSSSVFSLRLPIASSRCRCASDNISAKDDKLVFNQKQAKAKDSDTKISG